jgi:hypothetical protein
MKNVDKVVENRIEKHLELVEHNKEYYTEAQILPAVTTINGEEKDTDFRYARENLYHIIERGRDAMDELLEIAKAEESPRAFEVFGQLLKNMTDTQEKLMELHRKKQIIENDGERQEVTKAQNVTNALFVGSTADLLKLVKRETKQNA